MKELLDYWFGDYAPTQEYINQQIGRWFLKSAQEDQIISDHFSYLIDRFEKGELSDWNKNKQGKLALIILLDQIPRNLYRNNQRAHRYDEDALLIAQELVDKNEDTEFNLIERLFIYLPLQHSEVLTIQSLAFEKVEELYHQSPPGLLPFFSICKQKALLHLEAIQTFGRFPHRNHYLGRSSSPQEVYYLLNPEHHF